MKETRGDESFAFQNAHHPPGDEGKKIAL